MAHDDRIAALVRAWQSGGNGSLQYDRWAARERPSCGRCSLSLFQWTRRDEAPSVAAQRLGELLRLLAAAVRGGRDAVHAMNACSPVCPYTQCAWCEEADDTMEASLSVHDAWRSEPAILHDALFHWDATAASAEFEALRDAFHGVATRHASRAVIRLTVELRPMGVASDRMDEYSHHVDRLLRAAVSNDAPIDGIRLQRLSFSGMLQRSELAASLLRHPFALSLESCQFSSSTMKTMQSVCASVANASLAHVTRMTLVLDHATLDDLSAMRELCTFVSMNWQRLEQLSLMGSPNAHNATHRQATEMFLTALKAAPQLSTLTIDSPAIERLVGDAELATLTLKELSMRSLDVAVLRVASLERLTVRGEWHATALLRLLSSCPTLRELSIHRLLSDDDVSAREPSAEGETWPSLATLSIECGWHRDLLPVLVRSGATLTRVTLTGSLRGDAAAVVETLATHCPSVAQLSVGDIDVAFVDALVTARDSDRLRRLRELFVCSRERSIATACVRLLQVLSDARVRLTRSLQALDIVASRVDYHCVRLAMDLMLRCNATLVRATLEETTDHEAREGDGDIGPCFDFYESDLEQSDDDEDDDDDDDNLEANVVMATVEDDATRRMLHAMLASANATGTTAMPHGAALPDAVVLPSLRRCVAFMSALAALDVRLPVPLVRHVLMMAGRRPLRHAQVRGRPWSEASSPSFL
ncbi:hypothetical protein PINS_up023424 [Pythium insidiosum]|nr:hypothetical protein PINS_up023424 [Pythium insidiosum]